MRMFLFGLTKSSKNLVGGGNYFSYTTQKEVWSLLTKKKEKYKLSTRDIKWLRENNNRKNNVWIKISADLLIHIQ